MSEEEPLPRRRRRWPRALAWLGAGLVALVGLAVWGVDTGPGHRLIVDRIAELKIRTGLRIRIGRIDGSLWRHAVLRDVRLYDLTGEFFAAPEIRLDWHPLAWASNRLDIDRLAAPLARLDRKPKLRSTPNQPILPGFDIHLGELSVGRLRLGRALAGQAAEARLLAGADIRGRRARIKLLAASTRADRLLLDLDAEPDGDRFRLAARVDGPAGGIAAGLLGTRHPLLAEAGGRGTWHRWDGGVRATLAGREVARLAIGVRDGAYTLGGTLTPSPFLAGKLQRLTAPRLLVAGAARLADRRLDGRLAIGSPALQLSGQGRIDLARSAFASFTVAANLARPPALFPNMTGRDVRLKVVLDGPFRTAAFRYALTSPHFAFDNTGFDGVAATGAGRLSTPPVAVPIRLHAARVTGLGPEAGGILADTTIAGLLTVDARTLAGTGLQLSSRNLKGKLGLRLDLVTGRYDIALTGGLVRYLIPGLGIVDVDSVLDAVPGANGQGTIVTGHGRAAVRRFDNAFLRSLAGGLPQLQTQLTRERDGTLRLADLVLTAPSIRIVGNGTRRTDGSFLFSGTGRQAAYGSFRLTLDGQIDHPKVDLVLERPVPALGLTAVRLNLDPTPDGFAFRAAGGSYVGPFAGSGLIHAPPGATTTIIDIADLAVTGTHARGSLRTGAGGAFAGRLALAGGGIAGAVAFAPQGTLQRIDPQLAFTRATLAAATPVALRAGKLDGTILLDPAGTALDLAGSAQGLRYGGIGLARLSFTTRLRGASGHAHVALAGARGRAFDLAGDAVLAPSRIAVTAAGTVDRQPIRLAGPAVLTAEGDAWRLAPTRLDHAGGSATLAGLFGRDRVAFDAGLGAMPLALLDVASPGLGLGGRADGRLSYQAIGAAPPSGRLDLRVRGLTRSGLVLSSRPIDIGVAGLLSPAGVALRAVAASGGQPVGRVQARLAPLGPGGDLAARLARASLFAQARYAGPADALWRLIGVETIDLSGPITLTADAGGTLAAPLIRGHVTVAGGRLESSVTGTVVTGIHAAGRFDGSRLLIDQLAGTAGDGTVSGTGRFDLGGAAGVAIDIQLQATEAQLLNRDDIAATVTGPLRLRSSGMGGSISGDLVLTRSRYQLGATAVAAVPRLAVTEVNQTSELADLRAPPPPWTLDLHARAPSRLRVRGLGLDSEWKANLTIRGDVDNPAIGGKADLIQGGYQFAGRRFDLDRGTIRFSGEAPVDPILDIAARADLQGLDASIRVTGTGLHPEIGFVSTPQLPEDELLSRMLFGTSIASLSAPEALQLATAVASLRGGGAGGGLNLDPINAVRRIARLDRLRILPADVTTGQKTSIAAGKYITRRTYVEVVTDGAGYSATSVEFRITRWLSLLSSVSTIGRQSANVRVSKDY